MHRVRLSHHVNTNRTWTKRQHSVILDMKPNCRWWDAFPLAPPPNTEFKVLVITERVLHGQAPAHIRDLLQPHVTGRSWEKGLLVGQRSRLKTKGDHALPWSWLLNVGSPSNLMRTHRYFGDIPVMWAQYHENAKRECLQIWCKYLLWLNDEAIRIWWPKVGDQGHCDFWHNSKIWHHSSRTAT